MDILSAIIYGVIQGITEFLPISSSGHLALIPPLLKIDDPGVTFDLTMHIGTAFAVIIYFRSDLIAIMREAFTILKLKGGSKNNHPFIKNILISTFVTGVLGLLMKNMASSWGRSPEVIVFNLSFFGLLMWLFDLKGSRKRDNAKNELMATNLEIKKSIFIGFFQALAVFPGVSRSGSTLSISRLLGLNRLEAARYSFILSLPIILAGLLLKLPDSQGDIQISVVVLGVFISFIVGILSIHWFLKMISKWGLWVFFIYRLILSIIVLLITR